MNGTNALIRSTAPHDLERIVPLRSIPQLLEHISGYGGNTAFGSLSGEGVTYDDLVKRVRTFAGALSRRGVIKGDRVGIYLENGVDFAVSFLAATALGAVAALLPIHLPPPAVVGCGAKYRLKALVIREDSVEVIQAVRGAMPQIEVIFPNAPGESGDVADYGASPDDPCAIVFTGGTTGQSKGVRLSHRAMLIGTINGMYGYDCFGQTYYSLLPLTHVFGLIRNMLTSLYSGGELYFCGSMRDMFREMAQIRPTIMVVVPAVAELMLNIATQTGESALGGRLKTLICGAAPVSPHITRKLRDFGVTVYPGYGLTETANLVSGNPDGQAKPESVGVPYEGQELKIVRGELWIKGENLFDGYENDPESTAEAFEDGWFKTGDLARFDEDGYLYITGRSKEILLLPNGENISPAELEAKFNAYDTVSDSLVYVGKSSLGADILTVQALPRMAQVKALGIDDIEAHFKEILAQVNASLPSFQQIGRIVVRATDFKRSPSMKILRPKDGEEAEV
jgi:long-chain acyl-CoA synthetase